ncbi:MAG: hypothetical protein IPG08_09240 [Sphingobacteriaceae bacterium]|nr:hypothetical protein [Sphingobacteriaceae bacterium]
MQKYLYESESISIKDEDMDEDDINSLLTAAVLYHKLGVYDKSSQTFLKHYNLFEKSGKEKKLMDAAQLSYKYEKHKDSIGVAKEKEITELENLRVQEKAEAKLKQQRIIIFVSLFGFIVIIGFLFPSIRPNRNKEKANKEITHQRGLPTEKKQRDHRFYHIRSTYSAIITSTFRSFRNSIAKTFFSLHAKRYCKRRLFLGQEIKC